MKSTRRGFLKLTALGGAATLVSPHIAAAAGHEAERETKSGAKPFELDEVSINELQARMSAGKLSAVSLVKKYLARIEEIDRRGPMLASVIEVNPDALKIAA